MKIDIEYVQNILATQNYLDFDKLLTQMYLQEKSGNDIFLLKNSECIKILKNFDDIEDWKKHMVQIYGIFAFI